MPAPTRRRRLRAAMSEAIVTAAVAQVRAGGPDAVSLNAIGRELGTSGPALYRYFASRDALLAAVAARGYAELADHLEAAAAGARRRAPAGRLAAVAHAYRAWALADGELYAVVFSSRAGSGAVAPERLAPQATRAMEALLSALPAPRDAAGHGELGMKRACDARVMPSAPPNGPSPALAGELERWAAARGMGERDPARLLAGVRAWTRLHGVVSLELQGAWSAIGLDPEHLFDAEVASLLPG